MVGGPANPGSGFLQVKKGPATTGTGYVFGFAYSSPGSLEYGKGRLVAEGRACRRLFTLAFGPKPDSLPISFLNQGAQALGILDQGGISRIPGTEVHKDNGKQGSPIPQPVCLSADFARYRLLGTAQANHKTRVRFPDLHLIFLYGTVLG